METTIVKFKNGKPTLLYFILSVKYVFLVIKTIELWNVKKSYYDRYVWPLNKNSK